MTDPTRGLGRRVQYDERSRAFPVRAALRRGEEFPITHRWYLPRAAAVLDQGTEGACFTTDVLIRMADGSQRPIDQVRLLEQVATAEGRVGVVTQMSVRAADRGIVRVDISGHVPLRCTPEHPILTQRGYVPAADLRHGDAVAVTRYLPDADDEPIRPRSLVVDGPRFRGVLSGEVNTGGVISTVAPLPELLARTPALGRLIGLYAAEGCVTENKVVWSFGKHERETLAPETVALIKTVFAAEARLQDRPNGTVNVVLYGKTWRLLFADLVPGTARRGDKRLSGLSAHGPREYLAALLEGWLAGDGYVRRTEQIGVSVCKALALDMHAVATALGRRPAIRESAPSMNRHASTRQTRYDISIGTGGGSNRSATQDGAAVWRSVQSVTPEPYDGPVYNMEVEGDHSYIADGIGVHNCVGFGVTNELRYTPQPNVRLDGRFAVEQIYWPAQQIDPWDGGAYPGARPVYEGTSVLAGVKTAAALGWYKEYRWAFSELDLALAVSFVGPAVIGVPWHDGMFDPDEQGFLNPAGAVVGGHCVLVIGINTQAKQRGGFYTIMNSWGRNWADRGRAKISRGDMARLLANDGEACIITSRARPARSGEATGV